MEVGKLFSLLSLNALKVKHSLFIKQLLEPSEFLAISSKWDAFTFAAIRCGLWELGYFAEASHCQRELWG